MQEQLVNEDYLNNLIQLSKSYQEEGLITQLFQKLQNEYHLFLNDCRSYLTDLSQKKEFLHRIHRLKNNFVNLGCEEAGGVLEKMYQTLKADLPDQEVLLKFWGDLETNAEMTFVHLRETLQSH